MSSLLSRPALPLLHARRPDVAVVRVSQLAGLSETASCIDPDRQASLFLLRFGASAVPPAWLAGCLFFSAALIF